MQTPVDDSSIFTEVSRSTQAFPKSSLEPLARNPSQGPSSRSGNSVDSPGPSPHAGGSPVCLLVSLSQTTPRRLCYQTWFIITFIRTLMMKMYLWTLYNMWHVCWILYDLGCCNRLSRAVVVLDGLPGLYGFKYDSATACGLLLYLYSYKLVGSATAGIRARFNVNCHMCN